MRNCLKLFGAVVLLVIPAVALAQTPYESLIEAQRAGEQMGQGLKALIRMWLLVSGVLSLSGGVTAFAVSRDKSTFTEVLGGLALIVGFLVSLDLFFRWAMTS